MENMYPTELNYCNFPGIPSDVLYTCFQNELCCSEGCCPRPSYGMFRVWYFWFILLGLLFACSGGFKFCKVKQQQPSASRRRRNAPARRHNRSSSPAPPMSYISPNLEIFFATNPIRDFLENINVEESGSMAIDRYIACQNARNAARGEHVSTNGQPPSYNSLQKKTSASYELYGPPPQYSAVCKAARQSSAGGANLQYVEVHSTLSREDAAGRGPAANEGVVGRGNAGAESSTCVNRLDRGVVANLVGRSSPTCDVSARADVGAATRLPEQGDAESDGNAGT